MNAKVLLSFIPGWLGFLVLILVGAGMLLTGAIEPFGALDFNNKLGFITFGTAAVLIGMLSWIIGGTSAIKGRAGKVGVKVRIEDLPLWAHLVNGTVLAASIVVFLVLKY